MVTSPNYSSLRFTERKSVRNSRIVAILLLILVKHKCFTAKSQESRFVKFFTKGLRFLQGSLFYENSGA
jgi:hypothetical protein